MYYDCQSSVAVPVTRMMHANIMFNQYIASNFSSEILTQKIGELLRHGVRYPLILVIVNIYAFVISIDSLTNISQLLCMNKLNIVSNVDKLMLTCVLVSVVILIFKAALLYVPRSTPGILGDQLATFFCSLSLRLLLLGVLFIQG